MCLEPNMHACSHASETEIIHEVMPSQAERKSLYCMPFVPEVHSLWVWTTVVGGLEPNESQTQFACCSLWVMPLKRRYGEHTRHWFLGSIQTREAIQIASKQSSWHMILYQTLRRWAYWIYISKLSQLPTIMTPLATLCTATRAKGDAVRWGTIPDF